MYNNIIEKLESFSSQFTTNDLKILELIKKNPTYITRHTIVEIALKTNVSAASISRFSKKVGYDGFNSLKFKLQQSLELSEADELLASLCDDYITIIKKAAMSLQDSDIDLLISDLKSHSVVSIYGLGSSAFSASELTFKLKRIGILTQLCHDSHQMAFDAALLDSNNLVIAFSVSGQSSELNYALEVAKKNKAKLWVITSQCNSLATILCDYSIILPNLDSIHNHMYISRQVSQIYFIDTLYKKIVGSDLKKYNEKHLQTLSIIKERN